MTHTPGPWRVIDDLDTKECIGIYGDHQLVAEIRDPETIKLEERAIEEAMMRANAALIASAPALYALAQHVEALTEDAYLQGHPEWVALAEEAHVAVCTAEGRRP